MHVIHYTYMQTQIHIFKTLNEEVGTVAQFIEILSSVQVALNLFPSSARLLVEWYVPVSPELGSFGSLSSSK